MEVTLFSEDQGRAVVSCAPESVGALQARAAQHGVSASVVGTTGSDSLHVEGSLELSITALCAAWEPKA